MASYNRVVLMGNLCRDVELKYTPSGLAVTEVTVAVNDRRKNAAGEWVDEATFVDCTMYGRTAEIAGEYLSKGSPIFLEGRLKLDTWEKDGQKRSKLRVICERLQLMSTKGGENGGGVRARPQSSASNENRYPDASMQMDAAHEQHQEFEEESPLPF